MHWSALSGCGSCGLGAVVMPACQDAAFDKMVSECIDTFDETKPGASSEFCTKYMMDDAFAESVDVLPLCEGYEPGGGGKTLMYVGIGAAALAVGAVH